MNSVIEYFNTYSAEIKSILEVGCGTGNHAKYFCSAGYRVVGIDSSESMISEASVKRFKNFTTQQGKIANFSGNIKFDAVVSLFHVISYLENGEELQQSFLNIYQHLKIGGLFVFDVWHTPAVQNLGIENRVKTIDNDLFNITRKGKSKHLECSERVQIHYQFIVKDKITKAICSWTEEHTLRHFNNLEIGQLANFCGFEVLKIEELTSKKQPDSTTWSVCYVLRKLDE